MGPYNNSNIVGAAVRLLLADFRPDKYCQGAGFALEPVFALPLKTP